MSRRRVALVTGGASGIGEATAVELAERGFRVAVSDVAEERGRSVAESLDGDGHAFYAADVSDANAVEQLVRSVTRDLGGLDAAVNNAGIGGPAAPTGAYPLDAWRKVLDVNLDGVFHGLRWQIPAMAERGGGRIVNMGSILSMVGFAGSPAYVAAKHAVVGLTQNAALEHAGKGIRVNAVGPGFIETPLLTDNPDLGPETMEQLVGLHPVGRLGRAEEVAALVGWLLDEAPDFLTGAYIPIDGGYLTR